MPTEPEHPNTAPLMAIREALASWEKPALVLFGDSDPIFAPSVADSISRWIPGALPAELVENAGHFVQEDAGEEVAARIVEFLGVIDDLRREFGEAVLEGTPGQYLTDISQLPGRADAVVLPSQRRRGRRRARLVLRARRPDHSRAAAAPGSRAARPPTAASSSPSTGSTGSARSSPSSGGSTSRRASPPVASRRRCAAAG